MIGSFSFRIIILFHAGANLSPIEGQLASLAGVDLNARVREKRASRSVNRALKNHSETLESQGRSCGNENLWKEWFKRPIPLDYISSEEKPGICPLFLDPQSAGVGLSKCRLVDKEGTKLLPDAAAAVPSSASMEAEKSLYSHVWRQLTSNLEEMQTRRVLLAYGCSGSGKTKLAFDIGRHCSLTIIVPVQHGQDVRTPCWRVYENTLQNFCKDRPNGGSLRLDIAESLQLLVFVAHAQWALLVAEKITEPENMEKIRSIAHNRKCSMVEVFRSVSLQTQRNSYSSDVVLSLFQKSYHSVATNMDTTQHNGRFLFM